MNELRERTSWGLIAWGGAAAFAASLAFFGYSYLVRFGRPARGEAVMRPLAANLALFTAFALHHSVLARPAPRAWITRSVPPPLERSFYVWTASALFTVACGRWRSVPGTLYRARPGSAWLAAGYAVQAIGVVLTWLGTRAIDVWHLAGVRQATGREETAPAVLQTTGVYGLVRHPLYCGWVLMVFGSPHMTATRAAFAVISTAYILAAIPFEERDLARAFGEEYERYRRDVRWRILPGLW